MTPPTLLIFDIDGTLITTSAGRRAFDAALTEVYGVERGTEGLQMAGWTDPAIFARACEKHGLNPAAFATWKRSFLSHLSAELRRDAGHILPGVFELLSHCLMEPGFFLTLGTGNVEEGARLKLAPYDLNQFFADGGFGGDGTTRDEVIATAIRRASGRLGEDFNAMVVVGDTPLDIACGRTNGCYTVGVATGHFGADVLRGNGADVVLQDLSDWKRVVQIFHALSHSARRAAP